MSAAAKYTLGRIGLFLLVVLALWPVELNILLKLILALAFSAAASFFLLRGWRDEMAQQLANAADRRKADKERLRSALAGDEQQADERDAAQPPASAPESTAQSPAPAPESTSRQRPEKPADPTR